MFEPRKERVAYVMEYLGDDDLRRVLARTPKLPPGRAVHIGPHIALIGQMRRPVCKPICTLIGRAMSAR